MIGLGAGRVLAHLAGPATLFGVAITILYDAFQHHATDFTSIKEVDRFRVPKIWGADEAQEHDAEGHPKSCDQYQTVAEYHTRDARTQAGHRRAVHSAAIDEWSMRQSDRPTRSAALLQLIASELVTTLVGTSNPTTDAHDLDPDRNRDR
jgi:hypothetical protein